MNDVQLALLTLGFIVIIIMILHNWALLKKQRKLKKNTSIPKIPTIDDDNDPLFQSSEFKLNDVNTLTSSKIDSTGSERMIESNLPDGINRDIEAVASIVTTIVTVAAAVVTAVAAMVTSIITVVNVIVTAGTSIVGSIVAVAAAIVTIVT